MRILLTGGSGLVGSNIRAHSGFASYEVLAPSSAELNLLDFGLIKEYLRRHSPDLIIHTAGRVGGIVANMRAPVRFFLDNMDMGRNIVWAARESGIKRLINLGSSCMYPCDAPNPLREEMLFQGRLEPTNEGYALAKVATASLCRYIAQEDPDYQYKTLIPCNQYGLFDNFDPVTAHLIPAAIRKIHQAKVNNLPEVEIWGDGTARREFMFAGDLADCLFHAVRRFDTLPDLMNVGLGRDYTIDEYYEAISEVVGYKGKFRHNLDKPVGMRRKVVDITRQSAWGWQARTDLRAGLAATYQYFLEGVQDA